MSDDTDRDLLELIAASEVVLAQQAVTQLQAPEPEIQQRLDALTDSRLITRVNLNGYTPPAYRATRKGAALIDPALPPVRALSPIGHRHEIAITWLYLAAQAGSLGTGPALTRRQMQATDITGQSEHLLATPGGRFADQPDERQALSPLRALPDLAHLPDSGGWATYDIVLTAPDPTTVRDKLRRHHRDPRLRAQLFLVRPGRHIDTIINTEAQRLGIADRVHVQHLAENGIAGA